MCYIVGQLWYHRKKIIESLKQRAFNTGISIVLRAFCCRVAAFVTNPKYLHVPRAKDDAEEGLQRQENPTSDMGSDQVRIKLMPRPTGQRMSE